MMENQNRTPEPNKKTRKRQNIVKDSDATAIHYQSSFLDWALNLPQLRREFLMLYNINPKEYETNEREHPANLDHKDEEMEDEVGGNNKYANVVHSDFLELLKYSLDAQLNKIDKDINIFKLISNINVKVHLSSSRILCSNIDAPYQPGNFSSGTKSPNRQDSSNDLNKDDIIGLQTVIDSVTFTCNLVPKKMELDVTKLHAQMKQKKKHHEQNMIWKMTNAKGKLNFIYSTAFNGLSLAPLKPKEFDNSRRFLFDRSMDNPSVFAKFFDLSPPPPLSTSEGFDPQIDKITNSLFSFKSVGGKPTEEPGKNDTFLKQLFSLPEQKNSKGGGDGVLFEEDFDYDGEGIFFKANAVLYEQNKMSLIEIENNKLQRLQISHYLTLSQSKLLITYSLKAIATNVFSVKKKKTKSPDSSKKIRKTTEKPPKKETKRKPVGRQSPASKAARKKLTDSNANLWGKRDSLLPLQPTKLIKYVFDVEKPQFNLHDQVQNRQLLLTSNKNCRIIFIQSILPYDHFRQDLKITMRVCFSELECFVLGDPPPSLSGHVQPEQEEESKENKSFKVEWVPNRIPTSEDEERKKNDSDPQPPVYEKDFLKYEGKLTRIITCDKAIFENTSFVLDECNIDFSRPPHPMYKDIMRTSSGLNFPENIDPFVLNELYQQQSILSADGQLLWNGEPRMTSFLVYVGILKSYLESNGLTLFKESIAYLIQLVHVPGSHVVEELAKEYQEESLVEELNKLGEPVLTSHFKAKLLEQSKIVPVKQSLVEFAINSSIFNLTKDNKPFIQLELSEFSYSQEFSSDDSVKRDVFIREFGIRNLDEEGTEYANILARYNNPDEVVNKDERSNFMFILRDSSFPVQGITTNNNWEAFKYFEVHIPALTIRLTEEIYHKFYKFIFPESEEDDDPSNKTKKPKPSMAAKDLQPKKIKMEEKDKVRKSNAPSYYQYLRIGDLRASFSYKSDSIIKRMKDIKISVEPLIQSAILGNNKQVSILIFDMFVYHVKKRGVKLVLSVLGQKIGLTSGNMENAPRNDEIEFGEESIEQQFQEKKKKMLISEKHK